MASTLPETNIAPENRPSHSIPTIHFQVRTVSFREGNPAQKAMTFFMTTSLQVTEIFEFTHRLFFGESTLEMFHCYGHVHYDVSDIDFMIFIYDRMSGRATFAVVLVPFGNLQSW